jgi:hypothetical protein
LVIDDADWMTVTGTSSTVSLSVAMAFSKANAAAEHASLLPRSSEREKEELFGKDVYLLE